MSKVLRFAAAFAGAALALGATAGASQAAAPIGQAVLDQAGSLVATTYSDDAGVVHYAFDPARLPGAQIQADKGTVLADGSCQFDKTGSSAEKRSFSGPAVIAGQELTFDASTCTRTVAQATYPVGAVPTAVAADYSSSSEDMQRDSSSDVSKVSTKATTAAASTLWVGIMEAFYKDPVGIITTETDAVFEWTSAGPYAHYHYYEWYSTSGWGRQSYAGTNSSTGSNTTAEYKNEAFCAFITTRAHHTRTEFRGYTNGTWDYGWQVSKEGGCTNLLTAHYYVQTP